MKIDRTLQRDIQALLGAYPSSSVSIAYKDFELVVRCREIPPAGGSADRRTAGAQDGGDA